jgi:2-amino-4-hydroxy-6-hydroxymethyldihydropteridine diphosphokinase
MTDLDQLGFDAILALGSNVGEKVANIARAIKLLEADRDITVVARSRIYKTPPWGITDQDWFVNACVGVRTTLQSHDILRRCQQVENTMGRVRNERWGPRVIDVDILVDRRGAVNEKDLVLPHPRIRERAFVLAPLADIAPHMMLEGKPVSAWLAAVDRSGVEPMPEPQKEKRRGG